MIHYLLSHISYHYHHPTEKQLRYVKTGNLFPQIQHLELLKMYLLLMLIFFLNISLVSTKNYTNQ